MSFLEEIKRRKMFQVSAVYAVVAWLIIQIVATVEAPLNLPEWFDTAVIVLLAVGFPITLIVSWGFNLTPDGIVREGGGDKAASGLNIKIEYVLFSAMAVALLWLVYRVEFDRPQQVVQDPTAVDQVIDDAGSDTSSGVSPKSIAVLPFVDMSPDSDQEYFSDGISEELLNLLARLPGLKVAARTSSFSFKGKDADLRQIGDALNVSTVLEGSVRKSGNTIRITAQLVNVEDGFHLWSDTYDRELTDVFAIQDEIAAAVVEQLKVNLLGEAPRVKVVDPNAYTAYLQAIQLYEQYGRNFDQAISLYQQALEIEPDYAAAWSGLAEVYQDQAFIGQIPTHDGYREARDAANKAIEIDPNYARAYNTLGWVARVYDNDLVAAAEYYEHALALAPTDSFILGSAGTFLVSLDRIDAAIELGEKLVARDPLNHTAQSNLCWFYRMGGYLDKAVSSGRAAVTLNPEMMEVHYNIGAAMLLQGEYEGALAEMLAEPQEGWRLTGLALAYHALGQNEASEAALAELIAKYETSWASTITRVYAFRGDKDRAFEWLYKAVEYNDTGVATFPIQPLLAGLHDDPRWLPFLQSIGKTPEQLAAIKFEVSLRP